jgi:hypothetical protein
MLCDEVQVTISGSGNCPRNSVPPSVSCESAAWITGGCLGDLLYLQPGLNMDLRMGVTHGNFPPRQVDPILSSSPLISKDMAHASGPQPFAERPSEMGLVDLVIGTPLVQETDFELPFGGAVFRHIRTYSEDSLWRRLAFHGGVAHGWPEWDQTTAWDWNGMYWMMSESPVLLIDANYCWLPQSTRQLIYLILDAHHSIPFVYDKQESKSRGKPFYWAPSWFDAVMVIDDGVVDPQSGSITQMPTQYKVWLHRNSICYTFQPVYSDIPAAAHVPPTQECVPHDDSWNPYDANYYGRGGTPYYGLVSRIQDRFSNTIEYEYCSPHMWTESTGSTCNSCGMSCNEKGQIKAIRLKAGHG